MDAREGGGSPSWLDLLVDVATKNSRVGPSCWGSDGDGVDTACPDGHPSSHERDTHTHKNGRDRGALRLGVGVALALAASATASRTVIAAGESCTSNPGVCEVVSGPTGRYEVYELRNHRVPMGSNVDVTLYDRSGTPFRQFDYTAPSPGQDVDCTFCNGGFVCLDADYCIDDGPVAACVYTLGCSGGSCEYQVFTPDCDVYN